MRRLILYVTLLGSLTFFRNCTQPEAKESAEITEQEYPVKVMTLKQEMITRTLDYTANLKAFEEVYFAPANPGRINNLFVDVGDRVKQGQVIIEMEPTQLRQAEIQLENALSNYKRLDTLYRLESISEQQYEQTKALYDVARSNVSFLRENTRLESPINGIITQRYYEPMEMFSGAPNTPEGKAAVVTIMQINPLKASVEIPERFYRKIQNGMSAQIQSDLFPDRVFEGTIYCVYPTVDEATRSFTTEIQIINPKELLRPGMFARVTIELAREYALVAPAYAILQQEGTDNRYLFVNDDSIAKRINVKIGKRFDDHIEVISDQLQDGMELITAGHSNLSNGNKLRIQTGEEVVSVPEKTDQR